MGRNKKKIPVDRKKCQVLDNDTDDDDDIPEHIHQQLLENIKQHHGKPKIVPATRNEPFAEISAFNLSTKNKRGKPVFHENDLIGVIKKKQPRIAQKIESAKKIRTLPKPLETVQAKKVQRQIGFQNLKDQLNRWNDVVQSNRLADQLQFPLENKNIEIYDHTESTLFSSFAKPTSLEKEIAEILNTSEIAKEEKNKVEQSEFRLTLKELIEKRKMFAKVKAQASYKMAKAARQNKIKSKKYHRILKREKVKQQLKCFENLEKNDPEVTLKQLEKLEKSRAQERATLRHKNTGKWAHNQILKAKYNKESRIALSEQIVKSRELTQKFENVENDSSDVESDNETVKKLPPENDEKNPWVEDTEAYDLFISSYKSFSNNEDKTDSKKLKNDPNKYLKIIPRRLHTEIPDIVSCGSEELDDKEEERKLDYKMTISEAFAEDDVIAEFQEEKEKIINDAKPKPIDLSMPGWGSWTGKNINSDENKNVRHKKLNKRLLFRIPKIPPRKDENRGNVIINEEKNCKMKDHLVSNVPFPFTRVEDYEASIRAPVGRTWLPETAHQQLIAPSIVTKLGTVIDPIDENELFRK